MDINICVVFLTYFNLIICSEGGGEYRGSDVVCNAKKMTRIPLQQSKHRLKLLAGQESQTFATQIFATYSNVCHLLVFSLVHYQQDLSSSTGFKVVGRTPKMKKTAFSHFSLFSGVCLVLRLYYKDMLPNSYIMSLY